MKSGSWLGCLCVGTAVIVALANGCGGRDSSTDNAAGGKAVSSGGSTANTSTLVVGTCPAGTTFCDAYCTNTLIDSANCGSCGLVCPSGSTCSHGSCACSSGSADCLGECPASSVVCDGTCVNLLTNADHCGSCSTPCSGANAICVGGTCGALAPNGSGGSTARPACPAETSECGAVCTRLAIDPNNCGGCGITCVAGRICQGGQCVFATAGTGGTSNTGTGICPPGTMRCGPYCTNVSMDPANCGGCGIACHSGMLCESGVCACPTGTIDCGGTCINLKSDPSNCGNCGTYCSGPTPLCLNGSCVGSCPTGRAQCGSVCADLWSDRSNCGLCGNVCSSATVCSGGTCML